jgi:hypothetical protein
MSEICGFIKMGPPATLQEQACGITARISQRLWLPEFPDFNPPDLFLWDHPKESVYDNNPCSIEDLKINITNIESKQSLQFQILIITLFIGWHTGW